MKSNYQICKELAHLPIEELRKLRKKSLTGDASSPLNSARLFYMKEYRFITEEEFSYINRE